MGNISLATINNATAWEEENVAKCKKSFGRSKLNIPLGNIIGLPDLLKLFSLASQR